MKLLLIISILLAISSGQSSGKARRILFIGPMGSKSHKIFYMGVAEALAKRGNHVTMVSSFEPTKTIENIREVVIKNLTTDHLLSTAFDQASDALTTLFVETPRICSEGLQQKQIQDLKNEQFDVIIISMFFAYCYLSFVHYFKIPFIFVSSNALFGPLHDIMNNIDVPAISGNIFLPSEFPHSFAQRLETTVINSLFSFASHYYLEPRMYNECVEKGVCPPDMPSFSEINNNTSLVIVNSVRSLQNPQVPLMPNVIYAGGVHIEPPKELPKELEEWVQGSGQEGFIYFSLGSALKPSYLPEKYRKILIKVFGELKQRVLWKWDDEHMPDLPTNVKLSKWLPQPDILGHPKLRLFITHGGLLSTLESTFNGVPIIGIPVFADQYANMGQVKNEGWGKTIQWKSLEENVFRNLIQEVLNSKKMREIAHHRSILMKDSPLQPDESVAYWVEYVIKHKGAPHMMSPVRMMKWHQVYNIDVWSLIVIVLLFTFYIVWKILKLIYNKCCGILISTKNKAKRD